MNRELVRFIVMVAGALAAVYAVNWFASYLKRRVWENRPRIGFGAELVVS